MLFRSKESILDNEVKWDRESFDLVFWGGFLNKPNIIWKSSLDLYFLALDEDDSYTRLTRNRHIFTPGFRVFSDPEPGHALQPRHGPARHAGPDRGRNRDAPSGAWQLRRGQQSAHGRSLALPVLDEGRYRIPAGLPQGAVAQAHRRARPVVSAPWSAGRRSEWGRGGKEGVSRCRYRRA